MFHKFWEVVDWAIDRPSFNFPLILAQLYIGILYRQGPDIILLIFWLPFLAWNVLVVMRMGWRLYLDRHLF